MTARFRGPFAALVTPFTDDGEAVSEARLRAYCDFLIGRGIGGLFAFGTTGEWPLLAEAERTAGARVLVAAGARARARDRACGRPRHGTGRAPGVGGARGRRGRGEPDQSAVFPPGRGGAAPHFTAVARAVAGFPVFLYNIPEYAGNDLSPALLLRVAREADNVIGLKYSGDSLTRLREYRRLLGPGFSLFNGNDSLALPALHEGADGLVSGNASARPELLVALYAAFRDGKGSEAAERQRELDDFIAGRDPACELSTFKALLALRGVPVGDVRAPLKRVAESGRAGLQRLLR